MIFVGTDIVQISRIEQLIQNKGEKFLNHIFTCKEQEICNKRSSPSMHYSGKFAAKEAVKKAILSSKSISIIALRSIEIQNSKGGMPFVHILDICDDIKNVNVSIAHTDTYATATAILEII